MRDLENLFRISIRIHKIFDVSPAIIESLTIRESMSTIVEQICQTLECERAAVFKIDLLKGELWSQAAKGVDITMKYTLGQGIEGWVATAKQSLNIKEAYSDDRFNSYYDIKTGFKTTSILAIPIFNNLGEAEGVIQAVNKKPGSDNVIRSFSKDDEGLLAMVSKIAANSFRNSQTANDQILIHNSLRSILKCGIYLNTFRTAKDLGRAAESKLMQLFNSRESKLYYLDKSGSQIWRYTANAKKVIYQKSSGVLGQAIDKKCIVLVSNPMTESSFNALIDIETTMPLLIIPITSNATGRILGAFEVVNTRGYFLFFVVNRLFGSSYYLQIKIINF